MSLKSAIHDPRRKRRRRCQKKFLFSQLGSGTELIQCMAMCIYVRMYAQFPFLVLPVFLQPSKSKVIYCLDLWIRAAAQRQLDLVAEIPEIDCHKLPLQPNFNLLPKTWLCFRWWASAAWFIFQWSSNWMLAHNVSMFYVLCLHNSWLLKKHKKERNLKTVLEINFL